MKPPHFLTSPLTATAGVLVGMALLAVPLRQLTSAPQPPARPTAAPPTTYATPAWLKLKLLAPVKSMTLKTVAGKILWELAATPAGDVETQTDLQLETHGLDLTLTADFGDKLTETAVFLTIAPDGLEEQTRHAIGSGLIQEPLSFTWSAH